MNKKIISNIDKEKFNRDGYLCVKNFLQKSDLQNIKKKINKIFKLHYDTKVLPDKIKWSFDSKNKKIIRSQCNVWKSDKMVAKISLSKKIGLVASKLMNWNGTRLNQDSIIWVVPKTGGVSFHQDNPYQDWHTPGKIITCWIPLEKTTINGATLEYAVGSHKWGKGSRLEKFFDKNYKKVIEKKYKKKIFYKKIILNKGDVVFHHGNIWHGSGKNKTNKHRISLSIHLMSEKSKFHKKNVNPMFNHYKKFNSLEMDENFFPIIYSKQNYKISRFIKSYIK